MRVQSCRTPLFLFTLALGIQGLATDGRAATFGSIVPIRGTVSDIALDESRAAIYAANFSAYRVEVIDIPSRSARSPIIVNRPPSAVAVSPNNRFLVIGEYETPNPIPGAAPPFDGTGGLTIRDLGTGFTRHLDLDSPVLTVSFGFDGQAVVVTRTSVLRVDPATAVVALINIPAIGSRDVPVELAKVPTQIIQAASGVSGDRKKVYVLAAAEKDEAASSPKSVLLVYDVTSQTVTGEGYETAPPEGPRSVSVDQTGANLVFGWGLLHRINNVSYLWAQFPAADGAFHLGTHAWDTARNLIYAQIPAAGDKSVLHIVDTDNLTVRERIQLPETLSGRSLMSSDMNTMYSISISGLTILPIGQLPSTPQVSAVQEDILFAADVCNRIPLTQTLDILSLSTSPSDFTLSLPKGLVGVTLSATSGITPARVRITIDPAAFQGAKGTTSIPLTLSTNSGVNLPPAIRILVNTRDFNQRGTIVNIPGKIVDMLADPGRGRLYMIRQDLNQVQVYDTATLRQIGQLRTGNTPVQMATTTDNQFMIVGNDNSQIASVYNLDTLSPSDPILFPFGHYPRSIGAANLGMFGLVRNAGTPKPCAAVTDSGTSDADTPAALLDQIDFPNRVAFTPCSLGGQISSIFENNLPTPDGVIASSPDRRTLLLALADGNVAEYDSDAGTWVASRADASGLRGPYAAIDNSLYLAGPNLMGPALAPVATFDDSEAVTPSGHTMSGGWGVRILATAPNAPGTIQRWNTQNRSVLSTTLTAEAPATFTSLLTPLVGQIGESILSFTRSLAVSPDQFTIYALTTSGLTVLPADFDAVPQPPVIKNVVNTADETSKIAVGGAININGAGLAGTTTSAPGYPLPETLGEACATVNNIALPLFRVSPTQLVAQLPFTVTGGASLVVRSPGGISDPLTINVQTAAPAIFHVSSTLEETGLATVIRDDNGEVLTFTNPIHPNLDLTIYLTGLGLTTPLPALGAAAPSNPLATVIATPTVTLGTTNMAVTSAVLAPGMATVYQLKVKVPGVVQPGKSVPLTIQSGGNSTTLLVRVVSP